MAKKSWSDAFGWWIVDCLDLAADAMVAIGKRLNPYRHQIFVCIAIILAMLYLGSLCQVATTLGPKIKTEWDALRFVAAIAANLFIWASLTESTHVICGMSNPAKEAKATAEQLAEEESQARDRRLNELVLDLDAYYDGKVVYRRK